MRMRTVVVVINDDTGGKPWAEPFQVTSGMTAVEEVQQQLTEFNKHTSEDCDERFIIEVQTISVDLPISSMSKDELKALKQKIIGGVYVQLSNKIHRMRKSNLVSNRDGSDTYRCSDCGLEGKRTGFISSGVLVKSSVGQIGYCKEYTDFITGKGK